MRERGELSRSGKRNNTRIVVEDNRKCDGDYRRNSRGSSKSR